MWCHHRDMFGMKCVDHPLSMRLGNTLFSPKAASNLARIPLTSMGCIPSNAYKHKIATKHGQIEAQSQQPSIVEQQASPLTTWVALPMLMNWTQIVKILRHDMCRP